MANKNKQGSIRQRAFEFLNSNTFPSRKEAVQQLMEEFDISQSYAATIFQHNRNNLRKQGNIDWVYRVIDIKDSKTCDPYISSRLAPSPENNEFHTPEEAVKHYHEHLKAQGKKITKALKDYAIPRNT